MPLVRFDTLPVGAWFHRKVGNRRDPEPMRKAEGDGRALGLATDGRPVIRRLAPGDLVEPVSED